jgi:hypothetical protein
VLFETTIDITAPTPTDVPKEAWCRMLCFHIVARLTGDALSEASESLADIYSWQIHQARSVPQVSEQRSYPVSGIQQVERVPFVFDEG